MVNLNIEVIIIKNSNKLINETSPYLLQHAYNPVEWYSWCDEAFDKAKSEDKPIFLSIGYSTCHWCHVMAHESFEDLEVAKILNNKFISIKVDKEERPDVDSIYMNACQALTGSGGWPLTIFMTPDQKPFFAGTYFPKEPRYGSVGFVDLLLAINEKWVNNKSQLIQSGKNIVETLNSQTILNKSDSVENLINKSVEMFKNSFDEMYGGFGTAPKFPTPHNILFLLYHYEITKDQEILYMAEKTLIQMYKGGIFDHIGFGFSRYSTDRYWLAPHFEKMLYDNALLTITYLTAFQITKNELYKSVAEKTMKYVLRELSSEEGGFYCAQDADSEGIEGKYYVFTPDEITKILGEYDGKRFNKYFDITQKGNFEGKNIPNLIKNDMFDENIDSFLPTVYEYRKSRTDLHKDDKILTSWNSLMIVAFIKAYRILHEDKYLIIAKKANSFIEEKLFDGDNLFTSYRNGRRTVNGFLDDYAFFIFAQIELYESTYEKNYLNQALKLTKRLLVDFFDSENGGFYLYGSNNEQLILKPKETNDGAIPSGNSVMSYNLIKLYRLTKKLDLSTIVQKQLNFMMDSATKYPAGYSFSMISFQMYNYDFKEIVCVLKNRDELKELTGKFPHNANVMILENETKEYQLKNDKTTFYICENNRCLQPTNEI